MKKMIVWKLIAALIVGFLIAGALTKITYSCTPPAGYAGCASIEEAVMHPADLLNNKQNSLVRFVGFFVINSFFSFVVLDLLIREKQKRDKKRASEVKTASSE